MPVDKKHLEGPKVTVGVGSTFKLVRAMTLALVVGKSSAHFPTNSQGVVLEVLPNPALKGARLYSSRVVHPENGSVGEGNVPRDYFVPFEVKTERFTEG